jgi:cytochrome c553
MRYATKAGLITALWLAGAASARADVSGKLTACFGCHGPNGQSQIENVPSIAAQVSAYSLIQLVMFRDKLRVSDTMNDAAKDLSDSDIQSLADALAALPPRNRCRIQSIRHGSSVLGRWRSKTTATSATARIFPGSRRCRAWPTSVRTTC